MSSISATTLLPFNSTTRNYTSNCHLSTTNSKSSAKCFLSLIGMLSWTTSSMKKINKLKHPFLPPDSKIMVTTPWLPLVLVNLPLNLLFYLKVELETGAYGEIQRENSSIHRYTNMIYLWVMVKIKQHYFPLRTQNFAKK